MSLLEFEDGKWNVVYLNDNSHLHDSLSTFAGQKWWKAGSGLWDDANLWYRPLDMKKDGQFYYDCRRDAWEVIHGSMVSFDGEGFLRNAEAQAAYSEKAVWQVMLGDRPAGVSSWTFPRRSGRGTAPFHSSTFCPSFAARGWGSSSSDRR